jgi:acyl-CoA thioesterase I
MGMYRHRSSSITLIAVLIILVVISAHLTLTQTAAGSIRVACVGDSITEGSGYPHKLQTMLGSGYVVANFGVSGSTVVNNSTIPYMNQSAFERAKSFNPDIVIIMLGTNDANVNISLSEDNFEDDYSQLIEDFQQLEGKQLVWVVRSPPIFNTNSAWNNTVLETTILPHVDNVADRFDLPIINMYETFGNHTELLADGIHPTDDGSTVIASTVYDAITTPDGSPDTTFFGDDYSGYLFLFGA